MTKEEINEVPDFSVSVIITTYSKNRWDWLGDCIVLPHGDALLHSASSGGAKPSKPKKPTKLKKPAKKAATR